MKMKNIRTEPAIANVIQDPDSILHEMKTWDFYRKIITEEYDYNNWTIFQKLSIQSSYYFKMFLGQSDQVLDEITEILKDRIKKQEKINDSLERTEVEMMVHGIRDMCRNITDIAVLGIMPVAESRMFAKDDLKAGLPEEAKEIKKIAWELSAIDDEFVVAVLHHYKQDAYDSIDSLFDEFPDEEEDEDWSRKLFKEILDEQVEEGKRKYYREKEIPDHYAIIIQHAWDNMRIKISRIDGDDYV